MVFYCQSTSRVTYELSFHNEHLFFFFGGGGGEGGKIKTYNIPPCVLWSC